MIEHVILFKALELSDTEEEKFLSAISELRTISSVKGFASGKNFGSRSQGYDYCLRIDFDDRDALERYQQDPLHLKFVEYRQTVAGDVVCLDFEWPDSSQAEVSRPSNGGS